MTQGDLLRAIENDPEGKMSVLEAGSTKPIVAYPDELAFDRYTDAGPQYWEAAGGEPGGSGEIGGLFQPIELLRLGRGKWKKKALREHGWMRIRGRNGGIGTATSRDRALRPFVPVSGNNLPRIRLVVSLA